MDIDGFFRCLLLHKCSVLRTGKNMGFVIDGRCMYLRVISKDGVACEN